MLLQRKVDILNKNFATIDSMVIKFSGDDSYDVKCWVSDFIAHDLEDAFVLLNCTERMKLICERRLLCGTAVLFARSLLSLNYDALKNAIIDEFRQTKSMLQIYEELKGRKLGANESIQRYMIEMRMIAEKANIPETDLLDTIIAGLNDNSTLINILYQATNMQQLKIQLDRYQKVRNKQTRSNLGTEKLSNKNNSSNKLKDAKAEVRCFNCSQFGHFRNQCSKPLRVKGSCFKCGELSKEKCCCCCSTFLGFKHS
ncbi:Gag polyprotein [Lucilia cuprina]|nr:Gag polyprotein [Lucilia cuprina]